MHPQRKQETSLVVEALSSCHSCASSLDHDGLFNSLQALRNLLLRRRRGGQPKNFLANYDGNDAYNGFDNHLIVAGQNDDRKNDKNMEDDQEEDETWEILRAVASSLLRLDSPIFLLSHRINHHFNHRKNNVETLFHMIDTCLNLCGRGMIWMALLDVLRDVSSRSSSASISLNDNAMTSNHGGEDVRRVDSNDVSAVTATSHGGVIFKVVTPSSIAGCLRVAKRLILTPPSMRQLRQNLCNDVHAESDQKVKEEREEFDDYEDDEDVNKPMKNSMAALALDYWKLYLSTTHRRRRSAKCSEASASASAMDELSQSLVLFPIKLSSACYALSRTYGVEMALPLWASRSRFPQVLLDVIIRSAVALSCCCYSSSSSSSSRDQARTLLKIMKELVRCALWQLVRHGGVDDAVQGIHSVWRWAVRETAAETVDVREERKCDDRGGKSERSVSGRATTKQGWRLSLREALLELIRDILVLSPQQTPTFPFQGTCEGIGGGSSVRKSRGRLIRSMMIFSQSLDTRCLSSNPSTGLLGTSTTESGTETAVAKETEGKMFLWDLILPALQASDTVRNDAFASTVVLSGAGGGGVIFSGDGNHDVHEEEVDFVPRMIANLFASCNTDRGLCSSPFSTVAPSFSSLKVLFGHVREAGEKWSEAVFVQRTDVIHQRAVTGFILASMDIFLRNKNLTDDKDGRDRNEETNEMDEALALIVPTLVRGVTARLGIPRGGGGERQEIRLDGMKVAELLSKLLLGPEEELEPFEELEEERKRLRYKVCTDGRKEVTMSKIARQDTGIQRRVSTNLATRTSCKKIGGRREVRAVQNKQETRKFMMDFDPDEEYVTDVDSTGLSDSDSDHTSLFTSGSKIDDDDENDDPQQRMYTKKKGNGVTIDRPNNTFITETGSTDGQHEKDNGKGGYKIESDFSGSDLDSNSDSDWEEGDLIPYCLSDDEEDLRSTAHPRYLRDCLSLLMYDVENESDGNAARTKHIVALEAIPTILRPDMQHPPKPPPADLPDLAVPLTKVLLHAVNHFDVENFADLVFDGLTALICCEPFAVVDCLVRQLLESDGGPRCSLGEMTLILTVLDFAAFELSGSRLALDIDAKRKKEGLLSIVTDKVAGKRRFVQKGNKNNDSTTDTANDEHDEDHDNAFVTSGVERGKGTTANGACDSTATTTITNSELRTRRWGRRRSGPMKTWVNRFAPMASFFFYPVMKWFLQSRNDYSLWGVGVTSRGGRNVFFPSYPDGGTSAADNSALEGIDGRNSPATSGGAVGLMSRVFLTLSSFVQCSGSHHPGTSILAMDLFRLVWSFRDADDVAVRHSVLVSFGTALIYMSPQDIMSSIILNNDDDDIIRTLKRSMYHDSDPSCRSLAKEISSHLQEVVLVLHHGASSV